MPPTKADTQATLGCGCLALILLTSLTALIWALIYALLTH